MSSGYIFLYFGDDATPELGVFEDLLEPIGLGLRNPSTEQVFIVLPTGDQVAATREWMEAQISARRDLSFQWWYGDSEDVYCRFNPRQSEEQWCVEFGLDGVDEEMTERLTAQIFGFFKERCALGQVAALVVDTTGDLEETDWDAIIGCREGLRYVPDILVLPRTVTIPDVEAAVEDIGECPQHKILRKHSPGPLPF